MQATYISSNQFSVSTDRTLEFIGGRRLKADCGSDNIKYCTVSGSSYSSVTTVTTKESELTANLVSVLYGIIEPGAAGSLPDHNHSSSEGSGGLITLSSGILSDLYQGKQSIKVEYATTSGIYINPGKTEINNTLYSVESQQTKQLTSLSINTWYYIYVDPPASGTVITDTDIEYSITVPTKNLDRMGWYHGTNISWRCIGAVYSDGSSDITEFSVVGHDVFWYSGLPGGDGWQSPSNSWTTANLMIPAWPCKSYANFLLNSSSSGRDFYYRPDSGASGSYFIGRQDSGGASNVSTVVIYTSGYQSVQIKFSDTTAGGVYTRIDGFALPDLIYTGV